MNAIKYIFFAYILYIYLIDNIDYNSNNPKSKDYDKNILV
jgi:hypothetical protein